MSVISAASVRIGLRRLVLIGVVALVFVSALLRSHHSRAKTTLPPAHNPEHLHLLADAAKVVGWISGTFTFRVAGR